MRAIALSLLLLAPSTPFRPSPRRLWAGPRARLSPADMDWDPRSAPKLDFDEDLYEVLEVPPETGQRELKQGYYKVVFQHHPDGKRDEKDKLLANRQMMVINAAYKV